MFLHMHNPAPQHRIEYMFKNNIRSKINYTCIQTGKVESLVDKNSIRIEKIIDLLFKAKHILDCNRILATSDSDSAATSIDLGSFIHFRKHMPCELE